MLFETMNELLTLIREKKPLVLNITNHVTMDFVANGLLSMGASPIMSLAEEELEDLIAISHVVVINPGTLNPAFMKLSLQAADIANRLNKPLILDPVGVGASHYRTDMNMQLLRNHPVSIIRGNASEILALSGEMGGTKGVDSAADSHAVIENAKTVSHTFSACVLVSGKIDVVVEKNEVSLSERGSTLMPKITGCGCLLTAVVGAFHAVEKNRFKAASAAALFYGVCGEVATLRAAGPGSFKTAFLDTLHDVPEKTWYEKN
ncbi:MAG TPA: hydroxyethylthiazole kinase [Gammaproteobacteria bacterium]|nr:hydroxyethylthiazole kinase [Gammaproteobacteria bacterium]